MRSWNRWAAVLYLVAGGVFLYLGLRGPRADALRIFLGVVFIALAVWRYQRYRRAGAAGPAAPPDSPPRA